MEGTDPCLGDQPRARQGSSSLCLPTWNSLVSQKPTASTCCPAGVLAAVLGQGKSGALETEAACTVTEGPMHQLLVPPCGSLWLAFWKLGRQ